MTEAEWLACDNPDWMLRNLGRNPSKRKRRLFGCTCCRRIWSLIEDERSRAAVVTAEQFAAGTDQLDRAKIQAKAAYEEQDGPYYMGRWAAGACYCATAKNAGDAAKAWHNATVASQMHGLVQRDSASDDRGDGTVTRKVWKKELPIQADILRDIFWNPFRPITFSQEWRTDTAVALARQMYESREFGVMPILADALQDAGCDSADILNHCRGDGPHVRGCWVVDLVLGKG